MTISTPSEDTLDGKATSWEDRIGLSCEDLVVKIGRAWTILSVSLRQSFGDVQSTARLSSSRYQQCCHRGRSWSCAPGASTHLRHVVADISTKTESACTRRISTVLPRHYAVTVSTLDHLQ